MLEIIDFFHSDLKAKIKQDSHKMLMRRDQLEI